VDRRHNENGLSALKDGTVFQGVGCMAVTCIGGDDQGGAMGLWLVCEKGVGAVQQWWDGMGTYGFEAIFLQ